MHLRAASMKWAAKSLLLMRGRELSHISLADVQVASYLGAHLNQGLSDSEVTEVCSIINVQKMMPLPGGAATSTGPGTVAECLSGPYFSTCYAAGSEALWAK